jgi:spore coat polysaccharide biosynthesis protein SpsF
MVASPDMKTVIIVQARMTSTRLPGKVLKPVLGKPLLAYQLERLTRCTLADEIVIATTLNSADDPIVALAAKHDVASFRGSEDDVLSRYHGAALAHRADTIVRVTSDCPLIDPAVIDRVIRKFSDTPGRYDYVSNTLQRSYPRGMDTEVFSFQALDQALRESTTPAEREHVTPFIYRNPARYKLGNVAYATDESRHRWTVDTAEDLEFVRRMLEALYPSHPEFTLEDALETACAHPGWGDINQHVAQKEYGA